MVHRLIAARAQAVLVIDRAAVTQMAGRVDHENFARSLHQEAVRCAIIRILQHRKENLQPACVIGDIGNGVALVRIDRQEIDVTPFVLPRQGLKTRYVEVADRTARAGEHQYRNAPLMLGKPMDQTRADVDEFAISNHAPRFAVEDRLPVRYGPPKSDQAENGKEKSPAHGSRGDTPAPVRCDWP